MARAPYSTSVTMRIRGPVVEGKTAQPVAHMVRDVDRALADELKDTWLRFLKAKVRHWTGAYGRKIHVKHTARQSEVTDGGVVYGPWLEGTSRRNRTTRFKGYAAAKRARADVDKRAAAIANKVIESHLRELGR